MTNSPSLSARQCPQFRSSAPSPSFDPLWDLLRVPERWRILRLLLEYIVYDGTTGELELAFYPRGIASLAAETAMIGAAGGGSSLTRKALMACRRPARPRNG